MTDKILNTIKSHADLRCLTMTDLSALAEEVRQLIRTTVSHNGGHLASNLGVTELTIAMNYVFDFFEDRMVWDVGHQCYVHKILTGRAERFSELRQKDGISGFPDPRESQSDQFAVGHAGTSIATAVGLALGAQTRGTQEKIVTVVGDASVVNGLSFEGLNNTLLVNRQMLIILNDNSMAIDKTEGAFARYLTQLRLSRPYEDLQRRTRILVRRLPYIGSAIQGTVDRIKEGIKATLQGPHIFEQLRIPYFGPVDGHDIPSLVKLLTTLRDVDHPVVLHVQTEKGRGFAPAHRDPTKFHSPKPFKVNGETASFPDNAGQSFTAAFADALGELMRTDERVLALTAAMPDGTGLAELRDRFPKRVIDVGIAESAAVDIAAGLAKTGLRPVVAIYSTFLQRSFDQIFQEVSLQNLPVVFCLDRAGLVGSDGAVHHGFCDIALLRTLPNLVLMAPMDKLELSLALDFAVSSGLPCAIRYPRDLVPRLQPLTNNADCPPFELGKAAQLRSGSDAVILAYGSTVHAALLAAQRLAEDGFDVGVVSARFAKPLDGDLLLSILGADRSVPVFTIEDHALTGGFGSAVLEFAQENGLDARRIVRMGLPDCFIEFDSRAGQLAEVGIDTEGIANRIRQLLTRETRQHERVHNSLSRKPPTGLTLNN